MPKSRNPQSDLTPGEAKPRARAKSGNSHKHSTFKKNGPPAEMPAVTHEQIAMLAYSHWEARGYPGGSPEVDWLRAERELLELAQHG
ncbi:MAG: DUF2934 domain-containing protein [Acidobacteria bacterium]|nr:DUF2934 domain-containing protein [Acidobacteriota bacterium]MBI3279479.1 DUF2934 domain-containing protein [Acidobacteriota bacterium]